jgi:membrane protein implicated in regulation of membrane protease activity
MPPIAHGATFFIPWMGLALLAVAGLALIAASLWRHHRQRLTGRRPHEEL